MRELLYVKSPPTGHTRLSDWAREHADEMGSHYASELRRRRDRETPYEET
jgi:NADH dehydrogenase